MPTRTAQAVQGPARCRNDEEVLLLQRIAAGDRTAFETLYYGYAPRLAGYLARLLWQAEQIEEVLDDVMLAVWQQASTYQSQAQVSTWIFGIAHHKALTARGRASRQAAAPPPAIHSGGHEESPECLLTRQEQERTVVAAIATLPPEQRAVVELTYYHHCSYQEIAAVMNCPVNTVKKRMFLARRHLAPYLTPPV